jgi:hypothetical protein
MSQADEDQAIEYRRVRQAQEKFWLTRQKMLASDSEEIDAVKREFAPLIPDTGWDPPSSRPDYNEEEDSGFVITN